MAADPKQTALAQEPLEAELTYRQAQRKHRAQGTDLGQEAQGAEVHPQDRHCAGADGARDPEQCAVAPHAEQHVDVQGKVNKTRH